MRTLRRFFRRLSSWTQTRSDEERMRVEIEDHCTADRRLHSRWFIAGRSAAAGGAEIRCGRGDKGRLSRSKRIAPDGNVSTRRAPRLASAANAPAFTITTILTLALGIGATYYPFSLWPTPSC